MQWHGTICIVKVFLLSEREISPKYTGIFLHFVHGFGSYVKGLPKTKLCNSVAVTVSVRIRCICETALRLKSDEIENLNFMHICLPPLPPTCQDSNFICITRLYIPSTAHFNARQQISYKGMKHQPIIPSFTCSLFAVWH